MQIIFDLEVKEKFQKDAPIVDADGQLILTTDVKRSEYTLRVNGETFVFAILEPQNAKRLTRFEHDAVLRRNLVDAVRATKPND